MLDVRQSVLFMRVVSLRKACSTLQRSAADTLSSRALKYARASYSFLGSFCAAKRWLPWLLLSVLLCATSPNTLGGQPCRCASFDQPLEGTPSSDAHAGFPSHRQASLRPTNGCQRCVEHLVASCPILSFLRSLVRRHQRPWGCFTSTQHCTQALY
jgi:hypothetical protein